MKRIFLTATVLVSMLFGSIAYAGNPTCDNDTCTPLVVQAYDNVANGTVNAYNKTKTEVIKASNVVADGTVSTYNTVADGTVNVYDKTKTGVIDTSNKVANGTVATYQKVAKGTKHVYTKTKDGAENAYNKTKHVFQRIF